LVIRFAALVVVDSDADRLAHYQSAHTFEPETYISKATIGARRFLREVLDFEAKSLN
jgi:hypothetical protein